MKKLFLILLLLTNVALCATKYGAILIRDADGDSLAINADGSLNVTSTPSSDTAVVQLNGDTIPVNVTTDTLNVRSRVLNDSIDVSANIKNDTLNTRSRILNDSIDVSANIKNDSLNVRANITTDSINVRANITTDSINVSANIKNDTINTRSRVLNDSINVSANIKNDTINTRSRVLNDSINVSANIKNDTLNVRSRTLNDSVKVYDKNGYSLVIDGASGGIISISPDHAEIHEGNHYYVCGFATVADGDSLLFSVSVPDTSREANMTFNIEGTSQTEIYIIEGVTITGGTAVTPINNDRNSGNTSMTTVKSGATITATGDTLFTRSSGLAGVTPTGGKGGIATRDKEIILKNNAVTVFNIVSRDDGNIISYCGDWYEHIPEN